MVEDANKQYNDFIVKIKEVGKVAIKTPVNPHVLKWARESANLTIDEVTHKIKKSFDVIEAWENGTDSPTYVQLETLAYRVYKRPIACLLYTSRCV